MNLAPKTKAADTPARMPAYNPKRGENHSMCRATSKHELPQFIRDMIGSPPAAGSGVHKWMYNTARQLHAHRDEQTIVDLLTASLGSCERHVPQREILAAVMDAKLTAWQPKGTDGTVTKKPTPKWPALNHGMRNAAIQAAGFNLADLWDTSPIPCTQDSTDAEFFADALFSGNPLLCVGKSNSDFTTAPRESFRGKLGGLSLIVPSPMSALLGKKKNPKPDEDPLSPHTLDNTGPRRYLVTEFDSGTPDEQAALIWHLRQFAPLVLVLWSGSKSIHAWWDCQGNADTVTGRFMRYAVSLGADPATWTRSQFVRLPQGWRTDKHRRQEVYFFNPNGGKGQAL